MPILTDADPRLRQINAPIAVVDASLHRQIDCLIATLADFRHRHGFGRAIAAPQIGVARRLIAIDLGAGPFVLINPQIEWHSEQTFELWDDCFSMPDRLVRVRRHSSISVSYRDAQFRLRHWENLPAELAELLQHEIDHLDGVLMLDRAVGPDALRPSAARASLIDATRNRHRLSVEHIAEAARSIDRVFVHSPQYECAPLSDALGCRLTLKVETTNPIRCFKGRGADYFVSGLVARSALVCASAGNFGQAMAYVCTKHSIPLIVYAAVNANPLKLERMRALGADVRLEGVDFDAAKQAAKNCSKSSGARFVEDGEIAEISEGAGSIGVELLAGDAAFDDLVLPLGNGALLNGVARWIKAAAPATRVIGVCSRGAPAMAQSWRNGVGGSIVTHDRTNTIADGIAVRVPIASAVADMHGLVDDMIEVDDALILRAMRLLHAHAGLVVEPAGAAGVAALLADPQRFANRRVATVLCGGNLTQAQIRAWLLQEPTN